ncbi:MAG: hypothetical protein AAGC53_11915 [Actinomycetota bacterium]
MTSFQQRARRVVAVLALIVALAVPVVLVVSPSLITSSAEVEPPAFASDDFFGDTIGSSWSLSGSVTRTSTGGGSLTLDGTASPASISLATASDLRASVGFTEFPTDPDSQTGIVLRNDDDELFLGLTVDGEGRRSIQVLSESAGGVRGTIVDHPVGPVSSPVLAVSLRDGSYLFEVALDGDDLVTYGVFLAPFAADSISVEVDGATAVVDYVQDLRDPLLFEDGVVPPSAADRTLRADAGSAISIPDVADDGTEIISADAFGSEGEIEDYVWWLDGRQVGTEVRLTTPVPSGNHELQLEVFGSDDERDVVTVPVIIRSGTGISDDFGSDDELLDQWVSQGSVSIIPSAGGGALRLGGDGAGRIVAPIDVPVLLGVDYTSVAPVDGLETGLVIVDAVGRELRFGITVGGADDGGVAASAWLVDGDTTRLLARTEVNATSAPFLRLTRLGSFWRFEISDDGGTLETVAAFSDDFAPVAGGVYSDGGASLIDYISDLRTPLLVDDGRRLETVAVAPVIANAGPDLIAFSEEELTDVVSFDGTGSSGEIAAWRWALDGEPIGVDPAFDAEIGVGTYELLLEVVSSTGEIDIDQAQVTVVDASEGAFIESWYGDDITVNRALHPQRWINITGQVAAPGAILDVGYQLNGGPFTPISIGPGNPRLQNQGDFNIELDLAIVPDGQHIVDIIVRTIGQTTTHRVDLEVLDEGVPDGAPIEIIWSDVESFDDRNDVAVIDGRWEITDEGLLVEPSYAGYERLVGVGGTGLVNYEVTADVTVNSYHVPAEEARVQPAVGMIVRWTGHNQRSQIAQPRLGFVPNREGLVPAGAFAYWRVNNVDNGRGRFVLHGHDYATEASSTGRELSLGTQYRMKVVVEAELNGETTYSYKIWIPEIEDEPPRGLSFTTVPGEDSPDNGGVVLVAHQASVLWENVTITPTGR